MQEVFHLASVAPRVLFPLPETLLNILLSDTSDDHVVAVSALCSTSVLYENSTFIKNRMRAKVK